jgi:2-(1,2-epoxy-1,2-dihydrophenyl)acetyl-CoA isomerase
VLFFVVFAFVAGDGARLGIVNQVVAPEELESATLQLAERLRAAPPIALAAAKHAVYMSQAAELEEMLRYETEAQLRCFESDDAHEGVHAFLEKREPRFTGH